MMYHLLLLAVFGTSVLSSAAGGEIEFGRTYLDTETAWTRYRRRVTCTELREWQCHDRTCIKSESKCDGVVDCPDRSDESHAVCRNMLCQDNWFRCTYGACVDGTAPCNGNQECADNSDELLPRCRNETASGREFKCGNGEIIGATGRCDGLTDCDDGSDETLATCAGTLCPSYYFQCAYGACVDRGVDCNGIKDCADGSDEDDILCNRTVSMKPDNIVTAPNNLQGPNTIQNMKTCSLPAYPEHGGYDGNGMSVIPGATINNGMINFTCIDGYRIEGKSDVVCDNGNWQSQFPTCRTFKGVCKLNNKTNVQYRCLLTGDSEGTRKCEEYEPLGTHATHTCPPTYRRDDNYHGYMVCREDGWDNEPKCLPDCGTVTAVGVATILAGKAAERGELPWHTGIYKKNKNETTNEYTYMQICGGSLISTTMVISAANCFWGANGVQPAEKYAVALGKVYRNWNADEDTDTQKSDVKNIYTKSEYCHNECHYRADIALLVLSTTIHYKEHIRPVCIDFNPEHELQQLQPRNTGKVAGWGLISAKVYKASKKLKVVKLPYVDQEVCMADSVKEFKSYIMMGDKFCAGSKNATAVCKGDSGGGLVFLKSGTNRYYLRGIASVAHQTNETFCEANAFTTFTRIQKHKDFINEHWHE